MDSAEKKAYGWLGRPPAALVTAPRELVKEWKRLARAARQVANMRFSPFKVEMAKNIEYRRNDLIARIEAHANARSKDDRAAI